MEIQKIMDVTSVDVGEIAGRLTKTFAKRAAESDENDRFVEANYADLKNVGLISAGVPRELGGGGADVRALCKMLRVISGACGSTGLALSMHTHQVAIPAWRWHQQPTARPVVEPLLRRVADENIVLLSSGGSDWIDGSGTAERIEGGYRITAHKAFASGAPAGDLLVTGAILEEDGDHTVLHFAVPLAAPEVTVLDTWRTMGMRGTGSHDIQIDGFFVADDKIALKRKAGEWHLAFQMIATIAFPLIYSVYLGIAESAREIAIGLAGMKPVSHRRQSIAGRMDTALTAARLAHEHMIATVERDSPSAETINDVMIGRRLVEENAIRVVELSMELAGGVGFYRKSELERKFRDIQAARYHPLQKEVQAEYAGAMALGQPIERIF
ncbi:acyl-CoA dehydrogenase family protein [Jannaschia aquimarina]|uniref:YdbM protein n=1 Tax=Jannaschia aquimarina TaxID=935700 RepID=A0A0D1EKI1_9RHOB|nr:acyl-CoA dehydrogenase family protein [Jannaschia aquimarina]KIT18104.1 putative acyl-CoA dehydrogenase YdbM [Jannaschia aquimarina]SNT40882.1 Acyl-CoA dehydrogenase [Jannaschia aquimarina]